jgi:hypothetical protein
MRRIKYINKLLEKNEQLRTKIKIYFSTKSAGDDYDPFEKNYTYTNLNPITIRGYVSQLTPTSLVWRNYGLKETGAKEILCDAKYKTWFENCNKVEIEGETYQTFREGTGNRAIITSRPYNLIRVVLQKS